MKKQVRVLASAITAMLVATTLVGCKNDTKKQTSTVESGITLTVWSHLTDPEVKELNTIAQAWAKNTKNTVNVKRDQSDFQAFLQAANSAKAADIMYGMPHNDLGTFQKANLLAEVPSGVIDNSKYVQTAITACSWGGKMYAVPAAIETYGLFINTDLVKTVPADLNGLIDQAKTVGFQFDIKNFYFAYAFVQNEGGYVFKDKGNGNLDPKDIGLGDKSVAAYKTLQDMVQTYKFMNQDVNGDKAKAAFTTKKSGFYISGPWDLADAKKAGVPFKVVPLPGNMPSFVGVQAAFVNAKSKHQATAWDLMKYIQNNNVPILKAGGRIPAKTADLALPDFQDENTKAFVDQVKKGTPMPNIPEMSAVWTPAGNNLGLLVQGKLTPQDCGTKIKQQIEQGIAQMK